MPLLNDAGKDADAVYLGGTSVDAVYLGADKVWPPAPAVTWPYTWDSSQTGTHNPARTTPGMMGTYDHDQIEINAVDGNGATLSLPTSGQLTITNPPSGRSGTLKWTSATLLHGFWYLTGTHMAGPGHRTFENINYVVSGNTTGTNITGPVEIELLP